MAATKKGVASRGEGLGEKAGMRYLLIPGAPLTKNEPKPRAASNIQKLPQKYVKIYENFKIQFNLLY